MPNEELTIKKIERPNFAWGIFDPKVNEFTQMFESQSQAKRVLTQLQHPVKFVPFERPKVKVEKKKGGKK